MKHIIKNSEPISLTSYKKTPNATFNSCDKEDIRLSLIKEQGAICAYCMQRISNEWDSKLEKFKTEIEHYKSQDQYPKLSLDYSNMLGVCNGNAGKPSQKQHCDKSKDSQANKQYLPLTINPLDSNCENIVEYSPSGRIFSLNKKIDDDLNIVLNLNELELLKNRKKALDIAIQSINSTMPKNKKNQDWSVSEIKKERDKWRKMIDSKYKPFCQIVVYYLDKKIKKSK